MLLVSTSAQRGVIERPTTYRSQSGKVTPIKSMIAEHLLNAHAKLKRSGATVLNHPTFAALEAEKKARGL